MMLLSIMYAVLALAPGPAEIDAGPGGGPTPIVGGWEVGECGFPSTCEVWVAGAQCTGVLVAPQVVVLDNQCYDYADSGAVSFRFGETLSVEAPREACHFDGVFGICVLSAPLPIPHAPIAAGCETTLFGVGTDVALVGYGRHEVDVQTVDQWYGTAHVSEMGDGVFFVEGDAAPCNGDSGSPAYMRLADGSWRTVGMSPSGNCENPSVYTDLTTRIAWIEEMSGFDITPCHDADGFPDPGDECRGFYAGEAGNEGTWEDLCMGVPTAGEGGICSGDAEPPRVAIESPADGMVFDEAPVELELEVSADDTGVGLRDVRLQIDDELLPDELRSAPYTAPLTLPKGTWSLVAVARDWAGNETESEPVTVYVGEEPPSGDDDEGSAPDDDDDAGGSDESSETGDESDGGSSPQDGDDDKSGCACAASPRGATWAWLIAVLGFVRRRARVRSNAE